MTGAPAFSSWLDRFFEIYYREHPVDATFIGRHEHDARLPEPAASETGVLLHELAALPAERLSPVEAIDRDLARGFLRIQEWEHRSGHFSRNPAWYTGEAIFGLFSLLLRDFAPLEERLDNLRERLRAIPEFLERARYHVDRAPRPWTERAIRECRGALAFFSEGLHHVPLASRLDDDAARAASGFHAYRAHLEDSVVAAPSEDHAVGEDAFALLLREAHFFDWTPADCLARAETELTRSRERLRAATSNWREELEKLADHHPPRERYYERYREIWETSRAFAEKHALVTWPDYPVDYLPQPPWARAAAPALYFLHYRSPAPFDRLPRVDYLVTPIEPDAPDEEARRILRATNDSVIKLNHVVHHGGIGHHLQNWHAHRAASRIGQIAAVDCASRIAMLCGGTMAEGWACYATDLMDEAGFFTPLESYSQHHAHLRMAARAIVDVKLHCGAMSFAEAERFYVDHTAMSPAAARAEVTKNSMFPAAAMIYFAGAGIIHALRRDVASALGEAFDLRSFHDQFLSHGSIPVTLIRRAMLAGVALNR